LGTPMGRPKSAVFGTADIAGLDILVDVADGLYRNLPDDPFRETFQLPEFVRQMLANKWLGNKTGQGFYRRTKGSGGKREVFVLDPATMDYRPSEKVSFPSLDAAKGQDDVFDRIRTLISGSDRAEKLAWETTADGLLYAAAIGPEITDDVRNIDNAMKWGFNMEVGPFETWDALGVETTTRRMQSEGREIPPLVQTVLGSNQGKFYADTPVRSYYDFRAQGYTPAPASDNVLTAKALHKNNKVVKENKSASLLDMGDGVLLLEFHTKLNALDDDIFKLLRTDVDEAKTWGRALVIGNDSDTFSAGA